MMGSDPSYAYTYRAFEKYAKKIGADLIMSTTPHYAIDTKMPGYKPKYAAWLEKIYIQELLKHYDRVLYIDADILITPHAPDIFKVYPEEDKLYMLNEGALLSREKQINQVLSFLPLDKTWTTEYYNSGVMLVSKKANLFAHVNQEELLNLCGKVSMYEQTYFNYLIVKHGIKMGDLSKDFNRMNCFGEEGYRDSYFIHYAGGSFCSSLKLRYRTIIEDYQKMYNEPASALIRQFKLWKADLQFGLHELKRGLSKIF